MSEKLKNLEAENRRLQEELKQLKREKTAIEDVTAIKETEAELEKTSRFLKTLFANSPNPISIFDEKGRILLIGEVNARLLGYTAEECVGKTFRELLGPDPGDAFHQRIQEVHETKEPMDVKDVIPMKDGPHTFRSNIFPISLKKDEKAYYASFSLDITESETLKAELVEAKETAEEASKVKDQFLANMSHELRTPLNGIYGMLQLLETTDLTEEQKEFIGLALDGSKAITKVVEDILNYTNLERRAYQEHIEKPFHLESLLQEVIQIHQVSAAQKNLSLTMHQEERLPEYLTGDGFKLKQVLGNLLENAVKFTEKGAIHLSVKQESAINTNRIRLCFRVKDTGIGIPPEKLPHVFDRFSQADDSHTRAYGGLGLGLSIAKEVAESLGGHLKVDSKPGQGSVFAFTCEAGLGEENQAAAGIPETGEIYLMDKKPKQMKVLVVDDDYPSRIVAKHNLEKLGYSVDFATNGEEALEKVSLQPYDLILMDCQMPVMNGYEATRQIRAMEKKAGYHTPVVAMTANVLEEDREECIEAGMDSLLAKPFVRDQLEEVIRRFGK